jgi:hypothetical protein
MTGFPKGQQKDPLLCLLPTDYASDLSEVTFTCRTYELTSVTRAAQEELAEQHCAMAL